MAGLDPVSVPFDMCGTGLAENQLAMKLKLLEPVCCFNYCGAGCPSSWPLRKNLDAFPLRAYWNSTEC